MHQLYFYVPKEDAEKVKAAMFAVGAGRFSNYQEVCWQTEGQGQFKPLAGSNPHLGKQDTLEKVREYKVEMLCTDDCLADAIAALKQAHPYEEPAYGVWRLEDY